MTRKSRFGWQVDAFEPRVLLSAVPTLVQPRMVLPTTPGGASLTPVLATGEVSATTGDPTAPVDNTVSGGYVHAGRSLAVNAAGHVAALGPVSVSGTLTVTGPRSSQDVSGTLTLTGSAGSVTLQLAASHARNVVGDYGPVDVTETAIGATGNGTSLQGESGSGPLTLGRSVVPRPRHRGEAAHGSFWLFVGLKPTAG